jgi:hypothetical protein
MRSGSRQQSPSSTLKGFDGRALRVPRLGHGLVLSFFSLLWMCAAMAVALFPYLLFGPYGLNNTPLTLGAVVFFVVTMRLSGRFGTLALRALKWRYVNKRCRIVALRPFEDESASYLFRNVVGPTVGCYGEVSVVSDDSFARSELEDVSPHLRASPSLAGLLGLSWRGRLARKYMLQGGGGAFGSLDLQFLGDKQIALNFSDDEWQEKVRALISISDIAVIDLSLISINLMWETVWCLLLLPPHRIFFVSLNRATWSAKLKLVRDFLRECRPTGVGVPFPPPVLPTHLHYGGRILSTWGFKFRFFRAMHAIARLDREAAAAGTWHEPLPKPPCRSRSQKRAKKRGKTRHL